jgi:hypothetical protein
LSSHWFKHPTVLKFLMRDCIQDFTWFEKLISVVTHGGYLIYEKNNYIL